VSQRRAAETQQSKTLQQATEKGRMEIPQTNNLPQVSGIQQRPPISGVQPKK
jgi:hypothetical protein